MWCQSRMHIMCRPSAVWSKLDSACCCCRSEEQTVEGDGRRRKKLVQMLRLAHFPNGFPLILHTHMHKQWIIRSILRRIQPFCWNGKQTVLSTAVCAKKGKIEISLHASLQDEERFSESEPPVRKHGDIGRDSLSNVSVFVISSAVPALQMWPSWRRWSVCCEKLRQRRGASWNTRSLWDIIFTLIRLLFVIFLKVLHYVFTNINNNNFTVICVLSLSVNPEMIKIHWSFFGSKLKPSIFVGVW